MAEPIDLTHRFERPSLEAWRAQVRADLDGRDPEALRWSSPDGVTIDPLYVAPEHRADRGAPGAAPFVRGSEPSAHARVVHEATGADGDAVLASARRALEEGADAIWIGPDACAHVEDASALLGLGAPTWIEPGGRDIRDAWTASGRSDVTVVSDPLRAPSTDEWAALAALIAKAPAGTRPVLVSARRYHEAGASAVNELALAIASGVACLRGLSEAGAHLAELPRRMLFELALDSDFFVGVAKLRAARLLFSKVLRTLGIDGEGQGMHLRATSSRRAASVIDPQLNVLRGTASAFAAVVGGAQLVTIAPYDALLGAPSAHAERLARNTQLLLREESQLGRVIDPAGGSYFLEALTDSLARAAWIELGMIEHLGGVERGLADGSIAERVAKDADARRRSVATREHGIVGVSRYPTPEDPAAAVGARSEDRLAPMRAAGAFERVRLAAASLPAGRRRAIVLGVGDARALKPRMDFARDVLEVAGLSVSMLDARPTTAEALSLVTDIAPVVIPCASDEDTLEVFRALAPRLREKGAEQLVAAIKPSDALREAGATRFVHRGADLAAVLADLVAALEVA